MNLEQLDCFGVSWEVVVGLLHCYQLVQHPDDLEVFEKHFDSATNNLDSDLGLWKLQDFLVNCCWKEVELIEAVGHILQDQGHIEVRKKSVVVAVDCWHLEQESHLQCFHILENSLIRLIGWPAPTQF
jgi:hypothetical protein